jgi:hypothetical protein
VYNGKSSQTFRRNTLPPTSISNSEQSKNWASVMVLLPDYTSSHRKQVTLHPQNCELSVGRGAKGEREKQTQGRKRYIMNDRRMKTNEEK